MKSKKIEIFSISLNEIEIHILADMNPMQSEEDFLALKYSIEQIGQLEPVLMFKGKLVDGRNRLKALKELYAETQNEKFKYIKYKKLPTTLSKEELEEIIIAKETRRHKTPVQKAIQALNYYDAKEKMNENINMRKVGKIFGVSASQISKVLSLRKVAGEAVLQKLFNGGSIPIKKTKKDGTIYTVNSTSPDAIRKYYQGLINVVNDIETIDALELAYIQLKATEILDILSFDGISHYISIIEQNRDRFKTSYDEEKIKQYLNK